MGALGLPDWALTACWGGRPGIFLHQIAGGKTVGYSFLQSQNDLKVASTARSYYGAVIDSTNYGFAEYYYGPGVHVNLQGDPTLRMHPVLPVKGLTAVKNGGEVQLAWTASQAPNLQGYHIYRSTERLGVYQRLTPTPVTGLQYTDVAAPAAIDTYYQVRAIAREVRPTGTYFNQSQGAFALVKSDGSANRSPVAQAGTFRAKRNTPTPFTYPGSDADGDTLTPIILNNPQNGYLRWWNGRPYYISNNNYTGSDTITFAMSDGVAVSEPATMTVNVDEIGENVLLAWDFTDGSSVPGSTWNNPNVQPSAVSWSNNPGISNSFPNLDQYSFRFLETTKNRYVPITITPQPGRKVSLDEIRFALNGTENVLFSLELRASTDNFATSVELPLSPGNSLNGLGIKRPTTAGCMKRMPVASPPCRMSPFPSSSGSTSGARAATAIPTFPWARSPIPKASPMPWRTSSSPVRSRRSTAPPTRRRRAWRTLTPPTRIPRWSLRPRRASCPTIPMRMATACWPSWSRPRPTAPWLWP